MLLLLTLKMHDFFYLLSQLQRTVHCNFIRDGDY